MLDRLLGLETEYAIRFTATGDSRPTNEQIFDAYATAVAGMVATQPGMREREQFLANGGVIHYERRLQAMADGLVEGGTPECRGPSPALVYQRAQDALLEQATPSVAARLAAVGYSGTVGLLKNCRDADGHIYGAQENYEAEIARGGWLAIWRIGIAALTPLMLVSAVLTWLVIAALTVLALPIVVVGAITAAVIGDRRSAAVARVIRPLGSVALQALSIIERAIWEPAAVGFAALYRLVAFRHVRRGLVPFLVTRPVLTGAGTLDRDRFALSEKGIAARRLFRISLGGERVVFDAGNLLKRLAALASLDLAGYRSLYARKQRMQLGLSDSNMAQHAEYLKLATTCLVLDMAEAGALDEMPRLRRPIRTLHRVVRDPDAAFATQRAYVECARRFVREHEAPALEAVEVVERWAETLDAIERDPSSLIGRIDWITKRHLIDAAGDTPASRKKIDLKYHELGIGYFAQLEASGAAPVLVSPEEAVAAWRVAPADSPARARARAMRDLAGSKLRVGWDRVRVGRRVGGRVIRLDEHR